MKIFLSYSRTDWPFVRDLLHELRRERLETWVDLSAFPAATDWPSATLQAIQDCSCFIIVVSPYALHSVNVRKELDKALEADKKIIPVLLQDAELPEKLASIQWVDFRVNFQSGLQRLLASLHVGALRIEDSEISLPSRGL